MRNIIRVFLLITLFSTAVFAQGIGVPETLKINTLKGKVMTHLNRGDEPLSDVSIKLFKKGEEKVYKETKTNSSGEFQLGKLKRGNYALVASYPNLGDLSLYLLVSTSKTKTSDEEIVIWLGADFLKPCSGSYAKLKK